CQISQLQFYWAYSTSQAHIWEDLGDPEGHKHLGVGHQDAIVAHGRLEGRSPAGAGRGEDSPEGRWSGSPPRASLPPTANLHSPHCGSPSAPALCLNTGFQIVNLNRPDGQGHLACLAGG